ncbi:3'-5' exonuclease [Savitreella phatthalungensis]
MSNWEKLKDKIGASSNTIASKKRKRDEASAPAKQKKRREATTEKLSADVATSTPPPESVSEPLVQEDRSAKVGRYVALDCEMVGVNGPPHGPREESALARVSITNYNGHTVYDTYVSPPRGSKITDYRTWVSGIRPQHLYKAPSADSVKEHVRELLKGRILIGHALGNDFRVLGFSHPRHLTRDTSTFPGFKQYAKGKTPGLRVVCEAELGLKIQGGSHSSVEDAQATMALYRKYKSAFEAGVRQR